MVATIPVRGTPDDLSDDITLGGTAQVLAAANPERLFLQIANPDDDVDTGDWLWVNYVGGTAAANTLGSVGIPPGGVLTFEGSFVPTTAISIVGPTTSQPFTALQYPAA